jgi:hypothetical protein
MKIGKLHSILTLIIAAMLFCAERSQAIYTPYLTGVSNGIAAYAATLTNSTDKAQAKVVARVLKDLSKPSTSVASDYRLFLQAATHLGRLAYQPPFGAIGSNTFAYFIAEAQTNIAVTTGRIGALNDFVRTKRSASNQLFAAVATLTAIGATSDPQRGLLLASQVFAKLVAANKLAATGEAHPGFALGSLTGLMLHHMERNNSGDIHFTSNTAATETETGGSPEPITYTYARTGLSTATLVLNESGGTTTVKLRFTSTTAGTFTFRHVGGETDSGSGAFTLN